MQMESTNGSETQSQLITTPQQPASPAIPSADIERLLERFLVEAELAESTRSTYRRTLRTFFAWREERGIADLDRSDILAYKQDMLARVRPSTASTYLTAVKSLFKWLESVKAYPNIAASVKAVRLSGLSRKDALTSAQAKRDFALVNLLLRTALRSVEVHRAVCSDMRNRGGQTILLIQGKGAFYAKTSLRRSRRGKVKTILTTPGGSLNGPERGLICPERRFQDADEYELRSSASKTLEAHRTRRLGRSDQRLIDLPLLLPLRLPNLPWALLWQSRHRALRLLQSSLRSQPLSVWIGSTW